MVRRRVQDQAIRILFDDGAVLIAYGRVVWAGDGEAIYLNRQGRVCVQKNVVHVWQGRTGL